MPLQVNDEIEIRVNGTWKPAVIDDLYTLKGTDYLLAKFPSDPSMIFQEVMLINKYTVWRPTLDADLSA